MKPQHWVFSLLVWLAGCSGAADGHTPPEGFTVEATENGCPGALLVSESDYTSTNISALTPAGLELSESFISSESASPGVTVALSGDVVFPSVAPASGRVVLIDRYPNSVLTFVDAASGKVEQQISVGTGFGSNPHDYLELSNERAFVTRYEANPKPGREEHDGGSDVLILDPSDGSISGRIDLTTADDGELLPRPDHLLRRGDEVWVTLQGLSRDFSKARAQRIVGISLADESVAWTVELTGFTSCGKIALSPSGKRGAVACSGLLGGGALAASPESDVVLLDLSESPPAVLKSFGASEQLGAPLGSALAFASETLLVGTAFGDAAASRNDVAYTLDTEDGSVSQLYDAGAAFALGDLQCTPGCADTLCYLADAQANALVVWQITKDGELTHHAPLITGESIGLPPRALGSL